jgi:hypothetical protein
MHVADQYDKNAAECRDIARIMADAGKRASLLLMADTWQRMAADRRQRIEKVANPPAVE